MKIIFCLAVLLSLPCFLNAQQITSNATQEIVFRDVNVIPMDREYILTNQTVVIIGGKIMEIGDSKTIKYSKNAMVIEGKGKYLIPGLAEMHAHVPPIDDLKPMEDVLMLFATNGITTIRGMLGHPRHLELRTKVQTGKIISPHFYTTGPSFNGTSVKSPEEGAYMVRQQKKAGYDFLKLHPGLSRQKFDSIAAVARKVNIPFVGHVSFGVGVWRAIEAGYSSIDHLDGFVEGLVPGIEKMVEQQTGLFGMFIAEKADTTQIPRLMKALKENHIWVVPTQSLAERWIHPDYTAERFKNDPDAIYMSKEVTDQWISAKEKLSQNPNYDPEKVKYFVTLRRKLIKACQENGVGLLLGCDAPQVFNVPGFSTHNELQYLVKSGLTPYQALRTGTVNVAEYMGIKDGGVIKKGVISDLVLLNGNPLSDIQETRNISGVMIGTQWLSKEFISSELKKLRQ